MSKQDFKKELDKIKKNLLKMGEEAVKIAKKSEVEILKFSHRSKLHFDSTAYTLKKEKLYYQIGKEYVKAKDKTVQGSKLKKLISDLNNVDKEQKLLKDKIKKPKKKAVKKSAKKKK